MKITNKSNLPDAIVQAVQNDSYSAGKSDTSVTTLLRPPRAVALSKQNASEMVEDASDRIWALLGQAVHTILERADNSTALIEKRFLAPVNGWIVSGQIDRYDHETKTIQDYKITSAFVAKAAKLGEKKDFDSQLNMLAYLMRENGYEVERLQIVAILRDWSKLNVLRDPDYPRSQVVVIDIPIWSDDEVLEYISNRILAHQEALKDLPLCSDDDRWAKGEAWAVMKGGRKSALRVLKTLPEAHEWLENNPQKGNIGIAHRPPVFTRCEHYCSVSEFCDQFKGKEK